jgi:hypothetical protein
MAAEANNVTLSTNFNVDPFYDDFNEEKNFHRILFRPGLAVQARELTQMQTILQNQIDRFAGHIFKEGSTVSGLEMNYDGIYAYLKLRDKNSTGANTINLSDFVGKTIKGANSGVLAAVSAYSEGSESLNPSFKTLHIRYISANAVTDYRTFKANEVITAVGFPALTANTITSAQSNNAGLPDGIGVAVRFGAGIVYAKDHFIRVPEQTVILSKYSQYPSVRVGFDVTETIVTEQTDTTLLDPAQGSYNYSAPGAARLKLEATIKSIPLTATVSNTFVELMQVENGLVQSVSSKPSYSAIRDYMAQRTYDESGDYIVRGFNVSIQENLKSGKNGGALLGYNGGDAQKLSVGISEGKAYVKGYDIEQIVSSRKLISKSTDYESIESAKALIDYSNYVICDNVVGLWDLDRQSVVSLRDAQANAISGGGYSSASLVGNEIGTARVRGIELLSGTPGLPNAQYKFYLTDIKMNTRQSFSKVQSLMFGGSAKGKADILNSDGTNTTLTDPAFDRGVFRLPANAIRNTRNSSNNINNDFSFYRSFDITIDSSGAATINSGTNSETFDGSGTLSDAATRTDFYVVSRGTANSAVLTGKVNVTASGNTINYTGSGTSTTFTTQVNPGDIIAVANSGDYVVSRVVSATQLEIFGTIPATKTNVPYFKRFKPGQVLDFGGVGKNGNRSISISGTPSRQADFALNETLGSSLTATVIATLNKIDGQQAAKIVARDRLVLIRTGNTASLGIGAYSGNTTGPWSLGLSDGFKLKSVRRLTGSNFTSTTQGEDVTKFFALESGMKDTYYDHAKLVKKPGAQITLTSTDRLLVSIDHFQHSYSTGVGYFSVDSYPIDDTNAGIDFSKIYTYEIPIFTSPTNGVTYDLRNCIDIRPRVSDTANSIYATVSGISVNPIGSTSFQSGGVSGLHHSPPGQDFTTDLSYYLKRKDIVSITKEGNIDITSGVSSLNPVTPYAPDDAMPIAVISLAPYPSLSEQVGRQINRPDLTNSIKRLKNERFTMKDIGVLRDRIDRLEYLTSLTLLEKNSKDLMIPDENGLDRFKNGILVDSFVGTNIANVFDLDYKASINRTKNELAPLVAVDNTELNWSPSSSNVVRTNVTPAGVARDQTVTLTSNPAFTAGMTVSSGGNTAYVRHKITVLVGATTCAKLYLENATGNFSVGGTLTSGAVTGTIGSATKINPGDLVTLPYSHKVFVQQPYATTTRNCAGSSFNWKGVLELDPNNDYWFDTTTRPSITVPVENTQDNWNYMTNAWQTEPSAWQNSFVGTPTTSSAKDIVTSTEVKKLVDGTTQFVENFRTESITTTPITQSRTTYKPGRVGSTSESTAGQVIVDTTLLPNMRSKIIFVKGIALKPSSRLYAFFDGKLVSSYVTPLTQSEYNTRLKDSKGAPLLPNSLEGSDLYTNSSGIVYFTFRIPNDSTLKFGVGTKRLRLTDNPRNTESYGSFTTCAEADFSAGGLQSGVSDITISTRVPEITATTMTETRMISTTINNSIDGTRVIGVIPPPPPPPPIPAGLFKRYQCVGFDQYSVYTDGAGGETTTLFQSNAPYCGYVSPAPPPPPPPAPTYAIYPDVLGVRESGTVSFSVVTTNIADGTTLYWTSTGTATAADFNDGANSGSVTIYGNSGTITRTTLDDSVSDDSETFLLYLRTGSTNGTIVATSSTVTVYDGPPPPPPPAPTYSIYPDVLNVTEGGSVTFSVDTTNVADGTVLYWTTSGSAGSADFVGGATTGSVTITGNRGTITRGIVDDSPTSDNGETFLLYLRTVSTSGTIVATSATVTTYDVPPPPPAAPTVTGSFGTNPVYVGSATTLTWSATNSTHVVLGTDGVLRSASGSLPYRYTTTGTKFETITAYGPGGSAVASASVVVQAAPPPPPPPPLPPPPPPTVTASFSPNPVYTNQNSTLSWSSTNATHVTLSSYGAQLFSATGSLPYSYGTTGTKSETVTAVQGATTVSTTPTVVVNAAPPPPPPPPPPVPPPPPPPPLDENGCVIGEEIYVWDYYGGGLGGGTYRCAGIGEYVYSGPTYESSSQDPLAQTFIVAGLLSTKVSTSGVYLTKVDLFFSQKDPTHGITIQLQEVDPASGVITSKIVPFSRVSITSSEVNVSDSGLVATPVYFKSPVYLNENSQYSLVVHPDGNSPNYSVYTAVLGEEDINTGSRVTTQPAAGELHISSNEQKWETIQNEDLKFTMYYAEFDRSAVGNLILKNENRDVFTINEESGPLNRIGELVYGETTIRGTFANTKTVYSNGASYVQGMTSAAKGVITSFSSSQIKVKNVTLDNKFRAGEQIRIRTNIGSGGYASSNGPIVGNSTGNIISSVTPVGKISMLDTANYANAKLYLSNSSHINTTSITTGKNFITGMYLRGQTNGYTAKISSIDPIVMDSVTVYAATILPSNTTITAYGRLATAPSTVSDYVKMNMNDSTEFTSPRYIYSYTDETATLSSNSATIKLELECRNIVASPAVDLKRISLVGTHNIINSNTDIGFSEDHVASGGNAKAKYITRTVTLADGQDAEDLRVYLSAYKSKDSNVLVYYKVLNAEDSDAFGDAKWHPMDRDTGEGFTSETRYSSSENREDFFEMTYKIPDYTNTARAGANTTNSGVVEYRNSSFARFTGFKYFAIKVVLVSETSANPPRVRELRAIALQR